MTAQHSMRLFRIDDAELFRLVQKFAEVVERNGLSGSFSRVYGMSHSIDAEFFEDEAVSAKFMEEKFEIRHLHVAKSMGADKNIALHFSRTENVNGKGHQNASWNLAQLDFGNQALKWNGDDEFIRDIISIFDDHMYQVREKGESTENFEYSMLENAVHDFAALSRQTHIQFDKRIAALDEQRENLIDDFAKRTAELQEQVRIEMEDINKKRDELRLQSHMSERRRISESLSEISDKFLNMPLVPSRIGVNKWVVIILATALSIFSAYFAHLSFSSALDLQLRSSESWDAQIFWFLAVRGILASFVCVGSIFYIVGWLRKMHENDSRAYSDIRDFNLDMNRAGWIIETALEVQHEKKGEIPREWLINSTRGLFGRGVVESVQSSDSGKD